MENQARRFVVVSLCWHSLLKELRYVLSTHLIAAYYPIRRSQVFPFVFTGIRIVMHLHV